MLCLINTWKCLAKLCASTTPKLTQSRQLCTTIGRKTTRNHYEIVEPKEWQRKERTFGSTVERPNYAETGVVRNKSINYTLKSPHQLNAIKNSCRIARKILSEVGLHLKEGMSGEDIDELVYELCVDNNVYPSPLNYKGFPKCVTVSVNNIAVHGIPDTRKLLNGDIVKVDVSVYLNGYHGDCCHTYTIGDVDEDAKHLVRVAQECLNEAINVCRDGQRLCLIGQTIERIAKQNDLNVITEFCGHGVGEDLHEAPQILHYHHQSQQLMLESMVFTIEPVITEGVDDVAVHDDNWTVTTADYCRTAQFEHTIYIAKNNAIVLT